MWISRIEHNDKHKQFRDVFAGASGLWTQSVFSPSELLSLVERTGIPRVWRRLGAMLAEGVFPIDRGTPIWCGPGEGGETICDGLSGWGASTA